MNAEEAHEFELLMKNRPHVVILGAGATMAAIPNGDKFGRKSSVMNGFLEQLGMTQVIQAANLATTSKNLEDIYTELHSRDDCKEIQLELDQRIRSYFGALEIPDEPNIYDLLLLSLRKKDLIATFNWDPLLLQAYQRASGITKDLPDLTFLHGNVLVGYCRNHKWGGLISAACPDCSETFAPAPLLYPVAKKNYADDPYIKDSWKAIRNGLKRAYLVTIFGYSAPKTDSEAISLLKEAWGSIDDRNLEDFEMIDIQSEEHLAETWSEFIHSHHYETHSDFYSSSLARHPRRTTIELFDRTMNCHFTEAKNSFDRGVTWEALKTQVTRLIEEEHGLEDGQFLTIESA